jgi:AraC family transcriptional regulator, transcriptional activator FtrA
MRTTVALVPLSVKILPPTLEGVLRNVAAVLVEGVAPFEFGVVCEVFGSDAPFEGAEPMRLRVCGELPGQPLRSGAGVLFTPEYGLAALADADLVAVPAATVREAYPPAVLAALRAAADRGATLLSVCTGAFILGAAGLLDDRPCTTHWSQAAALAERFPAAKVDPDVLFVDDGDLVTSAGTAAGIDACLHLVRRELGAARATAVARRMVVAPQREGGQRQFVEPTVPGWSADGLQPVLGWMVDTLDTDHSVAELARRARMSPRTFARRFGAETGTTPLRWLTLQRVAHARQLLEETRLGVDEVARRCGFGTAALLRHHFRRAVGVTPTAYRRSFASRPVVVPPTV